MNRGTMRRGNFGDVNPDVHGKISKRSLELDDMIVTRVTFGVGARWSQDLKAYAGTPSCALPHVAYVVSGRLAVRMDDESEEIFGPGEVMLLPPGHDAWQVGDTPCVFVEFSQGNDYYDELAAAYHVTHGHPHGH
jgi:hypothetical protein